MTPSGLPRIALVGDRSPHVRSHARIPQLLQSLHGRDGLALDAYWISTDEAARGTGVAGFDGVWLLPGSPYRSEAGALAAVRTAREAGIPFLGSCAGFQHALLEFARSVCGLDRVAHAENDPSAEEVLIAPLACSLAGHEGAVLVRPGSRAEALLGARRTVERYHCSYGPTTAYLDVLQAHGMRLTGYDEHGQPRIAELPEHPFFLAALFQPELAEAGPSGAPHPFVRGFALAALDHAAHRTTAA